MILLIKTDQQEAYVGLSGNDRVVAERKWQAHKQLSDTLLKAIEEELGNADSDWKSLSGIVVFKGPGSFTGLRIGATVANTLSESLSVPVVGVQGSNWASVGVDRLSRDENDRVVLPEYGGEANITKPRK